ncbi:MAG: hypothetical protein J6Y00_05200 [Paludibacteraceae bacterium]|nr:hypothetical protein [Paludibacteraceae bacterium]
MTWRLPLGLVFVGLAALPVREAYRSLRISATQFGRDYTEQVFLSTLSVAVSGCIYPYLAFLLPLVPYLFHRRHILDAKGVWAFVIAVAVVALYFCIAMRLGWMANPFLIYF